MEGKLKRPKRLLGFICGNCRRLQRDQTKHSVMACHKPTHNHLENGVRFLPFFFFFLRFIIIIFYFVLFLRAVECSLLIAACPRRSSPRPRFTYSVVYRIPARLSMRQSSSNTRTPCTLAQNLSDTRKNHFLDGRPQTNVPLDQINISIHLNKHLNKPNKHLFESTKISIQSKKNLFAVVRRIITSPQNLDRITVRVTISAKKNELSFPAYCICTAEYDFSPSNPPVARNYEEPAIHRRRQLDDAVMFVRVRRTVRRVGGPSVRFGDFSRYTLSRNLSIGPRASIARETSIESRLRRRFSSMLIHSLTPVNVQPCSDVIEITNTYITYIHYPLLSCRTQRMLARNSVNNDDLPMTSR